ncbi:MAG: hypothetical protein RLZZ553_5 [Verrucomicrobiota bacterium]|jgi:hypothetical protein
MKKVNALLILTTLFTFPSLAWSPGVSDPAALTNLTVDINNREDVISFYQNVYKASENFTSVLNWSGNVDQCNEGALNPDFVNLMRRRINYYRALAGVPAKIVMNDYSTVVVDDTYFNDTPASTLKSEAAQKGALILAKKNSLTHTPSSDSLCFSSKGGNGCYFGNIGIGFYGPPVLDAYMREDQDNENAGHRRWILYNNATNFATGDIPRTDNAVASNVLYVGQRDQEFANEAAHFTPWPPAGFCPWKHASEYFSLSYPGADFTNARITVTKGGVIQFIDRINLEQGFGNNAIVWRVPSIHTDNDENEQVTYNVTVSNISGGGPTSYTYNIHFFNSEHLPIPPTLTELTTEVPGGGKNFSIGHVGIAQEYRLEVGKKSALPSTTIEGGEDETASLIIPGPVTGPGYNVHSNNRYYGGFKSLNIAFTDNSQTEQWVEIDRTLFPKAGSSIRYRRWLSYMTSGATFVAQYCINNDGKWRNIPGTALKGKTTFEDPIESDNFWTDQLSFQLPAETVNRPTRIRFNLIKALSTPEFITNTEYISGAFIDDISFNGVDWLSKTQLTHYPVDRSNVTLDGSSAGERLINGAKYMVRLQPRVGNTWMTSSSVNEVTITNGIPLTITTQLQSSSIDYNDSATLEVASNDPGNPDYQWYEGSTGDTSKPVGTNSSSFTTPQLTQTARYWVRVLSSAGIVDSVTATISVRPFVTVNPLSVTIVAGTATTLNVEASGSTPLDYQWFEGELGITTKPVGDNTTTFTTPTLSESANYWVRVTNSAGTADSAVANVSARPVILSEPSSLAIDAGTSTTISVSAIGSAPLSYQWYQGVSGDFVNSIPVGDNQPNFTTPALKRPTSYWVYVSNPLGYSYNRVATIRLSGFPRTDYAVGNWISRDFSALLAPGLTIKIVGKLPPGVTFNPKTGILQGLITKEGSYQAWLQVINGKIFQFEIPLRADVALFPASLLASYEAIVENANQEPIGALTLVVGKNVWSAALRHAGLKALSAKGKFVVDTGSPSASITIPFVGMPPLVIALNGNNPLINATWNDGKTLRGFKLASLAEYPLLVSNVGMVFDAGENNDLPAGFGWAAGAVSKVGKVAFKGAMSDGTPLSFSLNLSTTGQAILWAQPYKNLNSYFAGVVDLPRVGQPNHSNLAITRSCRWALHAGEKGNPYAFPGGVAVETRVAEIGAPAVGSILPVELHGPWSDRSDWPPTFTVDPKFNLIAANSDQVKWVGKVTPATGVIAGTYALPVGFSPEIVGKSAKASGIFLKDTEGNTFTGYGLIQIPTLLPAGSFRTMGITIGGSQ